MTAPVLPVLLPHPITETRGDGKRAHRARRDKEETVLQEGTLRTMTPRRRARQKRGVLLLSKQLRMKRVSHRASAGGWLAGASTADETARAAHAGKRPDGQECAGTALPLHRRCSVPVLHPPVSFSSLLLLSPGVAQGERTAGQQQHRHRPVRNGFHQTQRRTKKDRTRPETKEKAWPTGCM
jgi:hypothetical protein